MGKSLTVPLGKEFGSVFFDKLRAIILFEADFNWIQKIIFSNKMADLAKKHNLIPPEQCAAPGKDGNKGSLLKVFHTDHLRTMHIPHATISADLENCYDSVAQAVAALGMRAFGVRATTVAVFLSCYNTMKFWLQTAYGVAKEPYRSTAKNPFSSLLQGSSPMDLPRYLNTYDKQLQRRWKRS